MKAAIEHIQYLLSNALGVEIGGSYGGRDGGLDAPMNAAEESGDEVLLKIPQSDSDDSEDKEQRPNAVSSHHVSTLMEPSFCIDDSSRDQKAKLEIQN